MHGAAPCNIYAANYFPTPTAGLVCPSSDLW